jgi:hypothetical protein
VEVNNARNHANSGVHAVVGKLKVFQHFLQEMRRVSKKEQLLSYHNSQVGAGELGLQLNMIEKGLKRLEAVKKEMTSSKK